MYTIFITVFTRALIRLYPEQIDVSPHHQAHIWKIHFNISLHRMPRFLYWSPGILVSLL
jgi:hypothetical protein